VKKNHAVGAKQNEFNIVSMDHKNEINRVRTDIKNKGKWIDIL
jgi:hypothetical protein